MSVVLLTSNQPRHEAFINFFCKNLNVAAVIKEKKNPFKDSKLKRETDFFLKFRKESNIKTFEFEKGEINSSEAIQIIKNEKPEYCLVFGTSLLKKPILEIEGVKYLNIHTGLTQYYRGVDSCFWSVYNREPEKIGVTIHKVELGIDNGNIYKQKQTDIVFGDSLDDIFFKTCEAGFYLMLDAVKSKNISPIQNKSLGDLYLIKDKKLENIEHVKNMFQEVMSDYFKNKLERDEKITLIGE